MIIKGVAFDLEGTMVDVESAHHDGFLNVARDHGLELTFEEATERIPGWIGGGDTVICRGLASLLGLYGSNLPEEDIRREKMRYYEEVIATMDIRLRPGVRDVLRWSLQDHDGFLLFHAAIGSATPRTRAEVLIKKAQLGRWFNPDRIVLEEDVVRPKPEPDVFLETARRMGIDPKEQLVFEDTSTGIRAAKAAGSFAVAVLVYPHPENVKALIDAGADRIFWDWRELKVAELIENLSH